MTLSDVLGSQAVNAKVIASDIDTEVLSKAKQGVYRIEELKPSARCNVNAIL